MEEPIPRRLPSLFLARRPYVAWAAFLTGILLTVAMTGIMARLQAQKITSRFEQDATEARNTLEQRLQTYADVLKDVRGLYKLTNEVTRRQYFEYLESLDLIRRYPGILGLSFGVRVLPSELKAFEARMQDQLGFKAEGRTFAVFPPGPRPEHYVVIFGMPEAANRSVIGFDSGSSPEQLESLALARDTGQLQASGILSVIQDPDHGPGLILRLAVYRNGLPAGTVEERRRAFLGYANAVFRMRDLVGQALDDRTRKQLAFQFRDRGKGFGAEEQGPGQLFYDTSEASSGSVRGLARLWIPPLDTHRVLYLGGRMWDIRIQAKPGYVTTQEQLQPLAILLGGFLFSGALFALIRTLSIVGQQARELARLSQEKLSESES